MNLDDNQLFSKLDPQNMLGQIDGLPDQLQMAWELGIAQALPAWDNLEQILVAGMGGSAIGADLLAAYVQPVCRIPIFVHRDYDLPAWVKGPQTLVISSSHSGNTEETLSSFEAARNGGCRCLSITTGGKLAEESKAAGATVWSFDHQGQPRAAVGYSFGLLLAACARLQLIPDQDQEIKKTANIMRKQQASIGADVPVHKNMAKRLAGQLLGRMVTVMGSGILAPVARRWKGQISEVAKAWAQFELLPEADHNTLAGTINPEEIIARLCTIFLRSPSDHPRNRLRIDYTRQAFMLDGISTDFYYAQGESPLEHLWSTLHFGDYTSYYLAMAYGVDPTPVDALVGLKEELTR